MQRPATGPTRPPTGSQLLMLLRLLLLLQLQQVQGAALPINPSCDGSSHGQPGTRLYTSRVTRLSRPQRLLLQLAVLATLLMVLAPLVSRALQAPIDHAAMAGMDHAHMHHDAAVLGPSPLHGQRSPTHRPTPRHAWRSLRILRAGHAPAAVAGGIGAAVAAAVAAAAGIPVVTAGTAGTALAGTRRAWATARLHRPLIFLSNLPHDA